MIIVCKVEICTNNLMQFKRPNKSHTQMSLWAEMRSLQKLTLPPVEVLTIIVFCVDSDSKNLQYPHRTCILLNMLSYCKSQQFS